MGHFFLAVQVFVRFLPKYLAIIVLSYGPWLIAIKYFAATGALTDESAEAIAGLLGVFFMPLCNGAVVWLNYRHVEQVPVGLSEAITKSASVWKNMITAYISVGFIMLGWLAIALIPGGILMLALGLKSPLVLLPFGVVALIYVMTRYVFLDFFVVLRGLPAWTARRSCPELTKGRMLPLIVAYVLLASPLFFSEFAFNQFGSYLQAQTGLSRHFFEAVLSMLSTLLYVVPQLYFYLVYRDIPENK